MRRRGGAFLMLSSISMIVDSLSCPEGKSGLINGAGSKIVKEM